MPEPTDTDIQQELVTFATARIQRRRNLDMQLRAAQTTLAASEFAYDIQAHYSTPQEYEMARWRIIQGLEHLRDIEHAIANLEENLCL